MDNYYIENLSIDCVIFGFDNGELKTLLIKRNTEPDLGKLSLPGGYIYINEDLEKATARRLKELTGLTNVYLKEVGTFGNIYRFPERRVITIAYYALLKISDYLLHAGNDAQEVRWVSVKEIPKLAFDHNQIYKAAYEKLQERVRIEPIGFKLLNEKFTLSELQILYEQVFDTTFDKRNFRKKLSSMNLLIDTNEKQTKVTHRAAKLYKFDTKAYEHLLHSGFVFDL